MESNERHWRLLVGASLFALVAACGGGGGGGSHNTGQDPDPVDPNSPAVIPVIANDLVWDPITQRIYVSVSAATGPGGNVVIAVDPVSGVVTASQYVGSEPDRLSVSDDGAYLYVGVYGSSSVMRFILPSLTQDYSFSLGMNEHYGPNIAVDLAAAPGAARTLAVSIGNTSVMPRSRGNIVIYDDTVPRPTIAGGPSSIYSSMQWGDDASELFAHNSETTGFNLYNISVDGSGAQETADYFQALGSYFYSTIHYDRGNRLMYVDNGRVADPRTGEKVGEFVDAYGIAAPDSAGNVVYFADYATPDGDMPIRVFDAQTYELKDIVTLTDVYGDRTRFIRWGDTGFAFATAGGPVYITNSNGSRTATLPDLPQVASSIVTVPIAATDIVWDSSRSRIYASVPASAASHPNSIASINPATGNPTFVAAGDDPRQLALSDDRQYLYAGLDGTSTIVRYSLPDFAPDITIPLGADERDVPMIALDIQPLPAAPRAIAVALGESEYGGSATPGIRIFDDATARPVNAPTTTYDGILHINGFYYSMQFGSTSSELFALNSNDSSYELYRLAVTADGVSQVAKYPHIVSSYSGIHFDKGTGVLYFDDGHTAEPDTAMPVGRFPYAAAMTPDSGTGKAFLARGGISTPYAIVSWDLERFTPIAWTSLGTYDRPSKIIRFGADGLAILTESNIYLVRGPIVR